MRYANGMMLAATLLALMAGISNAQLIDPGYGLNSSVPLGVGIVSYGLSNIQYQTGPYQVNTNEVVGYARINSLYAYNASPPENTSQYGATVQLNVVMNVTDSEGNNYSYWIQNVMDLNTSNQTYYLVDNIWNMTSQTAQMSNATVTGYGNVTQSVSPVPGLGNLTTNFYAYAPNWTNTYAYPLTFIPVIKVQVSGGNPIVRFGYEQNGTTHYYDNVTFNISASSATILVTPYYTAPQDYSLGVAPSYYDAEMIVGGEASGEISYFSRADATLWMGYLLDGKLVPFPFVADFASDTAEAAQNLAVQPSNGSARLVTGIVDYNESIALSGVPAAVLNGSSPGTQAGSTTSIPMNYTTIPVANTTSLPTTVQQANGTAAAGTQGGSELDYAIAGSVVIIAILGAIYLLVRKMRNVGGGSPI